MSNAVKADTPIEAEIRLDHTPYERSLKKVTQITEEQTKKTEEIVRRSAERSEKAQKESSNSAIETAQKTAKTQQGLIDAQARKTEITLKDAGKKLTDFGVKSSIALTAPLALLGRSAVKSATEYESAFAGVRKTVDATEQEYKELSSAIRAMSKEIPKSAAAIANVTEIAGQLGIKKGALMDFTRVMIDLGEATNLSSEEAASSLAQFANIVQMSQKDFSKLGSTIVHLGNNMATTERDIVALGMRIAGAGKQVGLTEAQIMGLSAALSSVGIEAEMGGSAVSKLLINMNLASSTGIKANQVLAQTGMSLRDLQMLQSHNSKGWKAMAKSMGYTKEELDNFLEASSNLEQFSKVSGLTAEQFKKSFEKDAVGALQAFLRGLDSMKAQGKDATLVLNEMGITEVRLRDMILRGASAHKLFSVSQGIANQAWSENLALSKEASQRYATSESQMKIMKNRFEDTSIALGEKLLPHLIKLVDKGVAVVEWFNSLDPKMQDAIINMGLFAAAIGPVSTAIGGVIKLGSGLKTVGTSLGLFKTAAAMTATSTSSMSTAAVASGSAFAGLGVKIGSAIAATGPWGLAAAGVIAGGLAIKATLDQKVVPAIDLYRSATTQVLNETTGEWEFHKQEISQKTQDTASKFFKMSDDIKLSTQNLYLSLGTDTTTGLTGLKTQFDTYIQEILIKNEENKNNTITKFNEMFTSLGTMSAESKDALIRDVIEESFDRRIQTQTLKDEVIRLYTEMTTGTAEQQQIAKKRISEIYAELDKTVIDIVSENKIEQELLLHNLKTNKESMTTEMLSGIVSKYKENYDATVQKVNEAADEQIRTAMRVKEQNKNAHDETSKAAVKAADEMIKKAEENRKKQIESASAIREDGLKKIKDEYPEITKNIDANTGSILNWGSKFAGQIGLAKSSWDNLNFADKERTITTHYRSTGTKPTDYTLDYGKSYDVWSGHYNGLKRVPYDNYYARLHKDERVLTAKEAKEYEQNQNGNGVSVHIGSFVNNTKEDIEQLAKRLSNEMRRQRSGLGGF